MLHKCSQCNYITDIKCNLKRHQSRIHKNDNISSANIATNGVNISKKDVNISKKNDIPIDSFQCHKCCKVYGSENALSIHINTCKTILCKGPLECHKCNKIFTSIKNKLYHLNNCKSDISNLRPICKSCNCSMRTCNLEEYKQKYFINE